MKVRSEERRGWKRREREGGGDEDLNTYFG